MAKPAMKRGLAGKLCSSNFDASRTVNDPDSTITGNAELIPASPSRA
jgi:hypothetical protein